MSAAYLLLVHYHAPEASTCTVFATAAERTAEARRLLSEHADLKTYPMDYLLQNLEGNGSIHWGHDYEMQSIDVPTFRGGGVLGTMLAAVQASPTLAAVAHERLRQIEAEGYTPEHDDHHGAGEIAAASDAYLFYANAQVKHGRLPPCFFPKIWPWARHWWRPVADQFRNRVKGLALGCAEGDRLKRSAKK